MEGTCQIIITRKELANLVSTLIEEKLLEMIGDPEEDLELREELIRRLKKQKMEVAQGKRGKTLNKVIEELGLF